jgi:hypothetical protein
MRLPYRWIDSSSAQSSDPCWRCVVGRRDMKRAASRSTQAAAQSQWPLLGVRDAARRFLDRNEASRDVAATYGGYRSCWQTLKCCDRPLALGGLYEQPRGAKLKEEWKLTFILRQARGGGM